MELQNICLTTTYFQFEDKFHQQQQGMAVGNSLSLLVSNMFMEHFEEIADKPTKWLRYVDNTLSVWTHGPARLQQFLLCLNSVRPTINFTTEVEANDTFPFLDVLVVKRDPKLATKVYRKRIHTGCYLHFKSSHPYHVKRGVVHSLISRAKAICQDQKDFNNEIRHDLMLNEYP
jgi:hypothetical protein